ncbi:MAG: hypothetical protein JHC95_20725, partial [Solirubrobacteraceae bacterium]|nr:hypothetical protein [Solirubrobacteraceae bacterium]
MAAGTTSRSTKSRPKPKAPKRPAKKVTCKKPRKGASRKQVSAYKKCLAKNQKKPAKKPTTTVRPLSPAAP